MNLAGPYCHAQHPDNEHRRCHLDFPHPGRDHEDNRDVWSGRYRGNIVDTALGFTGSTLEDRVAISLMVQFGRLEPENGISKHPASYVAVFADLARAIVAQFEVTDRITPADIPNPDACRHCGTAQREHAQLHHPNVGFHEWAEPTDEQRKERMLARRRQNEERVALHG